MVKPKGISKPQFASFRQNKSNQPMDLQIQLRAYAQVENHDTDLLKPSKYRYMVIFTKSKTLDNIFNLSF